MAMVDFSKIPQGKVGLGSTVVVLDTNKDEEITYNLVTSEEAAPANGKISTTSPIGRALLGKEVGDTVKVQSPGGVKELEILKLTTIHAAVDCPMTYTRLIGITFGWVIGKIVDALALSKIHPNVLTFIGLLINIWAACLFAQGRMFAAGLVVVGASVFDMVDGRVARQ